MSKYPGRIISATPPTVSLSEASGVWTLEEVAQYQEAGTWPIAVIPTDPNFNQTVLLLHGDGTNGAQNNTFLDGSTNNFTITRNGNTTQGTFSPFSVGAGEWSNFFDGTDDNLSVANNAALNFGTGTLTIEAWIYMTGNNSAFRLIVQKYSNPSGYELYVSNTNKLEGFLSGTTITSTSSLSLNTWYHVALVRAGTGSNQTKLYINGVEEGTATSTGNLDNANAVFIGTTVFNGNDFAGYISNVRITNTAVYTAAFTPSTTPLTAISGTRLLTCQSNRFVDNSTNAFAITRNGDVRVTPFSPFAPSAAYDPAVNGGSGYFDGNGDSLTVPDNSALEIGSGDFTVEAWIYLDKYASAYGGPVSFVYVSAICGKDATTGRSYNFQIIGTASSYTTLRFEIFSNDSTSTQTGANFTFVLNTWYHVAATRSGTSLRLYVNGTDIGGGTNSVSAQDTATTFKIGTIGFTNFEYWFPGYISNLRVVKGTAITPPSGGPASLVTAISGTSLLLNFTNAGIFDNTGKNNLETVGDAQIDTGTKKYGTGSMEFDGTGDWLLMAHNPDQQLGTGNFTIEFWVYLASGDTGSARGLVAKGTSNTGWLVSLDSSQKVVFTYTTSTITSSGAITTNAWNHIAVVREGTGSNQTKIYIGGTNDGTGTVSTDFNQTSVMYVGCNRTAGDPMKGFIDDLRVTKGVARYTGTFTPPTSAFQDQ